MKSVIIKCSFCNKEKKIFLSKFNNSKTKNFFCNIRCKSFWQINKKLSEDTKKKISISTSKEKNGRFVDGHCINKSYCECGNEKDWRAKKCNKCYNRQSFKDKKHSYLTKLKIGEKSKNKFTPEFNKKFRKIMEQKNIWIPLENISDYEFYCKLSSWPQKMFDLNISGKKLLKEYKIFSSSKREGVVRDHKVSRKYGFDARVYPEIIRHPCNCDIILHNKNSSKRSDNSISLKELFVAIDNYKEFWFEQEICLKLIKDYELGHRYNRCDYERRNLLI